MNDLGELERAKWFFAQSRYGEAADLLVNAVALDPGNAAAHALLALCQCGLKQNALARHHAYKAVELEPRNPDNHFILSRVLVRLFDWEWCKLYGADGGRVTARAAPSAESLAALKAIQEALLRQPENPDYHAHLALLELLFAHHDEAIEAAEAGLAHRHDHPGCLHYLAQTWLELGEPKKAEEAIQMLLSLDPNSPYGHAGLGDVALYRRKGKQAEQHFLEALRLDPLHPWPEHGLMLARSLETDRAFARELLTPKNDPLFSSDPLRPVRQLEILARIIVIGFAALVVAQLISVQFWPGRSLFGQIIRWLANL